MGGKGGGGTNTQQNQNVQYTPYGQQNLQNIYNAAANAASQPYRSYTGQLVAGLTPGQQSALRGLGQAQGVADNFYNRGADITRNAAQMARQGAGYVGRGADLAWGANRLVGQGADLIGSGAAPINKADIARYLDPYTDRVINTTMANMQRQNAVQQQGVTGNAAMQGALGGDRSAIAQAELAKDQNMNMAQVVSNLQSQGYGQALQTAMAEQQAQLQGGSQMGSLAATQGGLGSQLAGMGGQQAGIAGQYGALGQQYAGLGSGLENQQISGALAQMQGEQQRQQTQQAYLNSQYQQYQQMLAFPYQQAQFLASIGLPATQAMGGYQTQIGQIGEQIQPPWWNLNTGGNVPHMAKGGKSSVSDSTFSPYFFNPEPGDLPHHAGDPIYLPGQTIQPMSQLIGPSGPFGNPLATAPSSTGMFNVYGAIPIGAATHPSDLQGYIASGGNKFQMQAQGPGGGGFGPPPSTAVGSTVVSTGIWGSSLSSAAFSHQVSGDPSWTMQPYSVSSSDFPFAAGGGSIGHYAPGGSIDDDIKMPWDIGAYDITGGGSFPGTMQGTGMPKLQVSDARPVPMPMAPPSHPPQQQSPVQALSQMMSLGKQAAGLFKPGAAGLSGAATPSAAPATLSGAEGGSGLAGAPAAGVTGAGASPATLAGLESGSGLSGVGTAAAGAGADAAGGLGASEAAGMIGATGAGAGLGAGAAGATDAASMLGAGAAGAEAAGAATAEAAADAAAMTGAAGVAGAAGAEALGTTLAADVAGGLGALGALFMLARGGAVGRFAKGGSVSRHQTVPEARHTLLAQQKQLVKGSRRVQMFPTGTPPLPLPAGMKSMSTPSGVFHYDPTRISAGKIRKASAEGRENDILDLGPYSKDDVLKRAKKGERPLVAIERDHLGREVKTAAGTSKTVGHQASVLRKHKSHGHTVHIEDPRKVLAERLKRPIGLAYGGEVKGYDDGGEVDDDTSDDDFFPYGFGVDGASQPIDHGDIVPQTEAPKFNPLASSPAAEMAGTQAAAAMAGGMGSYNPFDSATGLDSKAIKAALGMSDTKPVIPADSTGNPFDRGAASTPLPRPRPDTEAENSGNPFDSGPKPRPYVDPSGMTYYNPYDPDAPAANQAGHKAVSEIVNNVFPPRGSASGPETAEASLPPPNKPLPESEATGNPFDSGAATPLPKPRPENVPVSQARGADFDATANQRAAAAMGYSGDSPEMRAAVAMDNARVQGGFGGTGTTMGNRLTATNLPKVSPSLGDNVPTPQARPDERAPMQAAMLAPQPLPAGMSRPPANVPVHLAPAIASVAQTHGADPMAVGSVIKMESNFNPRSITPTGTYLGLPQMSMADLRELGYDTKQDFLNAPPEGQIAAYSAYLDKYGFSDKMKAAGINFASLSPPQQAAVLQGFQFSPNATGWMKAAGQGNWDVPTTNTKQAGVLGNTSLNHMTSYFAREQAQALARQQAPAGGATNAGAPFPAAAPSVPQRMSALESITHDPLRTLINIGASDFTHGSGPMVMQGLQRTVGDYDKFSRDDLSAEQKASELNYKLQALAVGKFAPVNLDMGGGKTAVGAFDTKKGEIVTPGSHEPITGATAITGKTTSVTQTANSKAIDARWAAKERLSVNPALDPTTVLNEERVKRGMPPATPTEAQKELQDGTQPPPAEGKPTRAKDGSSAQAALPDPGEGKRVKGKWYIAPDGKPRPWQG